MSSEQISMRDERSLDYDVALSFANEDREFVRAVAEALKAKGIRVFYDEDEEIDLWGKDLFEYFSDLYRNSARFCILFISEHYAKKKWANHERQNAQTRALNQHSEYILPARFDQTNIPGLRDTIHYVDLNNMSPDHFAGLIEKKISCPKSNFLPPVLDVLMNALGVESQQEAKKVYSNAHHFYSSLKRMTPDERLAVMSVFLHSCPDGPPINVHREADFLRRVTGFPVRKLARIYSGLVSLGFAFSSTEEGGPAGKLFKLEFYNTGQLHNGNATDTAYEMIQVATRGHCEECSMEALGRLDFACLSSITVKNKECEVQDHAAKRNTVA